MASRRRPVPPSFPFLYALIAILAAVFLYLWLGSDSSAPPSPKDTVSIPLGSGALGRPGDIQGSSFDQSVPIPLNGNSYSPQNPAAFKPGDLEHVSL